MGISVEYVEKYISAALLAVREKVMGIMNKKNLTTQEQAAYYV